MKIAEVNLFQYRLRLARPLLLKSRRLTEREGLVVRLADQNGHVGWGEIAPLPGFSAETFDEACESAVCALRTVRSRDLPDPENLLESGISAHLNAELPPSVACGIESAAMNLWSHGSDIELRHLIDPTAPDSISVNGLLTGSKEEVIECARQMISSGYEALKLKVGSDAVAGEIDKVKSVRTIVPNHLRLRLDANRSWDYDTAVRFGRGVSDLDIEYIEEPLVDSRQLENFYEQTGHVYALDESLVSMSPKDLSGARGLKGIILKTTLLGGLAVTWQFARRAKEIGLLPVISSAFESSIGLVALANLAAAIAPTIACGLDTASWFADDLLSTPMRSIKGRLPLADYSINCMEIRRELLTEIPVA